MLDFALFFVLSFCQTRDAMVRNIRPPQQDAMVRNIRPPQH